ncbi:MAG: transposase, partial [Bacteroidales bacterium]
MLSQKVSGTSVGMWLLVPELLRLGAWDIIKAWTGKTDTCLEPRIALQVVNETALCVNRIRRKNSLGHQGFQLANGMGRLVTDEQVHTLLNNHTASEAQQMLVNLGIQRKLSGHYPGDVIAVDPHRIISSSKRVMAKKRKHTDAPSKKMLQTFFSVCTLTGQPIMASISSTGLPTSKATANLIDATGEIIKKKMLLLADKEHFTREVLDISRKHKHFDFLIPALNTSKLKSKIQGLNYKPLWAGFAIAETDFCFTHDTTKKYRLIAERTGEIAENYSYNAFITTSKKDAKQLICNNYDKRWSVEEFFRFENDMGLNRASTLNLNVRYGKLALAMI